ncbi:MFS transporter [Prescottella defluvii]|uniref:MFS transporter n=1 Tax=Prescottella defluvii TaxID=1323361 RepID=UPI0004F3979C|nr:MFS transporter [Prescottella defluvii]
MATTVDRGGVGLRSQRGPILASLMLTTSLVALEGTILATSFLTIVDDLGGFTEIPWLFSGYLLAQAITVPIYGRLADILGRRPVMLWGIGLLAVSSVLCAVAWSMSALVAFRILQGIAAGAITPIGKTIAGDVYTVAERAKVQGYLGSVWAVSAVLGPTMGGLFSEFISWRAIFIVNVPLCALAGWMLVRNFTDRPPTARRRIDYTGAALLSTGAGLLILGLIEGGDTWAWTSPVSIAVFAGASALLTAFVFVEQRVADPILPLQLLTRRTLVAVCLVSLFGGALVTGLTGYIPTFTQGVLGVDASIAGFALVALSLGWPVAAAQSSRLYLRHGFRATVLAGAVLVIGGTVIATQLSVQSTVWHVSGLCFVIGIGMGLVSGPSLIAAQSSVEWAERGVATSTVSFAGSIGGAVGLAVFGALANASLGMTDSPGTAELAEAMNLVFLVALGTAVAMALAAAVLPRAGAYELAGDR